MINQWNEKYCGGFGYINPETGEVSIDVEEVSEREFALNKKLNNDVSAKLKKELLNLRQRCRNSGRILP